MIDFNKVMQDELETRREGNTFAVKRLPNKGNNQIDAHITIDEETDLNGEFGPQQVQSLLGLVVDFPLHHKMEGALDDEDAVRHLNRLKK